MAAPLAAPSRRALATLCERIMADPEAATRRPPAVEGSAREQSSMAKLLAYASEGPTRDLAMASLAAVFVDILPSYRVRVATATEQEQQQTKEVYRLRQHEASLLASYRSYLKLLRGAANTLVGVRCLAQLAVERPRFNYADEVLGLLARKLEARNAKERETAIEAFRELIARDAKRRGDAALAAIKAIGSIVAKGLKHEGPLLALEAVEVRAVEAEPKAAKIAAEVLKQQQQRRRKPTKKGVTAAEVKAAASSLREAEAGVDPAELDRRHREMGHEVAVIYARALKTASTNKAVVAAAARGIARIAHAVNADVLGDVVALLSAVAADTELGAASRFDCAHAAIKILRSPGYKEALGDVVDDAHLVDAVYASLLAASVPRSYADDRLPAAAVSCLRELVLRKADRAAAFARRALLLALHASRHAPALVALASRLVAAVPAARALVDDDDEPMPVGVGARPIAYDPLSDNADAAGALASPCFELAALANHYDPDVRRRANDILRYRNLDDDPSALLESTHPFPSDPPKPQQFSGKRRRRAPGPPAFLRDDELQDLLYDVDPADDDDAIREEEPVKSARGGTSSSRRRTSQGLDAAPADAGANKKRRCRHDATSPPPFKEQRRRTTDYRRRSSSHRHQHKKKKAPTKQPS